MVGLDSADDAAVWKLDERQSLVITTDFFTPVVDDPYDYGAIAAANSLSDVYAMGAKPFLALNISAFPSNLPNEITQAIVRGAAEKCREAGVVIAGGHTITDNEPKFGLVAIGIAESDRILTKGGAKPGDHLFLSKPLGFGVTTTAMKRGLTSSEDVVEVTGWMKRLNLETGQLAVDCGLKSATDITGFGLLGHASEIAQASGVGLDFEYDQIPFIDACHKFAREFTFPGGASDNKLYFEWQVSFDLALNDAEQMLLFDPQTSGGLLMCVPEDKVGNFQKLANERGILVWEIGVVSPEPGLRVHRS